MNDLLKMAFWYQGKGYSVILVKQNKKPYIKWECYQTQKADESQIRQWWKKWPGANIGIVTGEISGLNVIDVDTDQGLDAIKSVLEADNVEIAQQTDTSGLALSEQLRIEVRFIPALLGNRQDLFPGLFPYQGFAVVQNMRYCSLRHTCLLGNILHGYLSLFHDISPSRKI